MEHPCPNRTPTERFTSAMCAVGFGDHEITAMKDSLIGSATRTMEMN
jgi:hypothetical protein